MSPYSVPSDWTLKLREMDKFSQSLLVSERPGPASPVKPVELGYQGVQYILHRKPLVFPETSAFLATFYAPNPQRELWVTGKPMGSEGNSSSVPTV